MAITVQITKFRDLVTEPISGARAFEMMQLRSVFSGKDIRVASGLLIRSPDNEIEEPVLVHIARADRAVSELFARLALLFHQQLAGFAGIHIHLAAAGLRRSRGYEVDDTILVPVANAPRRPAKLIAGRFAYELMDDASWFGKEFFIRDWFGNQCFEPGVGSDVGEVGVALHLTEVAEAALDCSREMSEGSVGVFPDRADTRKVVLA